MKLNGKTCLQICGSAFLLFIAIHYWDDFVHFLGLLFTAAIPLLIGCVIAYIANIPMSFYERHYFPNSQKSLVTLSRRPVCMLLAFISIVAVVFLVLYLVIPEVGKCVTLLLAAIPSVMEEITEALSGSPLLTEDIIQFLEGVDWESVLVNAINFLKNGVGTVADLAVNIMTSVISGTVNFIMGFIFSVYLLTGKERLFRQMKMVASRYTCMNWRKKGKHILSVINDCFHRYIVGQCTEAVILGGLCSIGMAILGFPYAAVVGATVGLTALIPVAGAYIGGTVGFLLIFTVSPVKAIIFVIYLLILQQVEGNIIYPKVVGTSLGLPGMWVLAAVIVGGGLGGIFGIVLSVPLTACIYRLIKESFRQKEKGVIQ